MAHNSRADRSPITDVAAHNTAAAATRMDETAVLQTQQQQQMLHKQQKAALQTVVRTLLQRKQHKIALRAARLTTARRSEVWCRQAAVAGLVLVSLLFVARMFYVYTQLRYDLVSAGNAVFDPEGACYTEERASKHAPLVNCAHARHMATSWTIVYVAEVTLLGLMEMVCGWFDVMWLVRPLAVVAGLAWLVWAVVSAISARFLFDMRRVRQKQQQLQHEED